MYFPSKKDVWFGLIIWGFVLFLIAGYIIGVLIIGLLLWFVLARATRLKGLYQNQVWASYKQGEDCGYHEVKCGEKSFVSSCTLD